jgi:hemerythrin-like domain-containing protein
VNKEIPKMQPTDILTNEHTLIKEALDVFLAAAMKMEVGEHPPVEFFEKAVEFIRDFADKYHHFKEEHLMFGMLAAKNNSVLDAKIDVLKYQHERGREHVSEISNALDGYSKNKEIQATIILENISAYTYLIRRHISIEDHSFFVMADIDLSIEEQESLSKEFKKQDNQYGEGFFIKSRNLVVELKSLL